MKVFNIRFYYPPSSSDRTLEMAKVQLESMGLGK